MSAAFVPNLTLWTQNNITAIFQATDPAQFTSAIDAFLSDKVQITLNGSPISRSDFANQIQAEKFDEASASLAFTGAVEVPIDANNPTGAGSVGVFYNATVAESIRLEGGPIQSRVTASVNVVIAQDPDVPKPPPPPVSGVGSFFDARRVMSLNQVSVQAPVLNID